MVARHERSFGSLRAGAGSGALPRRVAERKPGALAGSRPLQQWRRARALAGELRPSCGRVCNVREGKQAGTRTMIELLQQGSKHGWEKLKQAVAASLGYRLHGCGGRVRHLLVFGELSARARGSVSTVSRTGTLRASAAGDERLRPAAEPKWRRWRDEASHGGSGTCQRKAVLQGAAGSGDRR